MHKIGFIGAGNMARAIIKGMVQTSYQASPSSILVASRSPIKPKSLAEDFGVSFIDSVEELCQLADRVILACKPQQLAQLSKEAVAILNQRSVPVVSILAGTSLATLSCYFSDAPIVRAMPNTSAAVGEAMTLLAAADAVQEDLKKEIEVIFSGCGDYLWLDEASLDRGSVLSGCGPAFFYVIAEGMIDAGVRLGLTRHEALQLVAQTMRGCGTSLGEGQSPALLKDAVTSPAGTTIEGVVALEKNGVRYAMIEAIEQAYQRTLALSQGGESHG